MNKMDKIPFGQMNVINEKIEIFLFLFAPSICRRRNTGLWLTYLSFANFFFPREGSEIFLFGIPMLQYFASMANNKMIP